MSDSLFKITEAINTINGCLKIQLSAITVYDRQIRSHSAKGEAAIKGPPSLAGRAMDRMCSGAAKDMQICSSSLEVTFPALQAAISTLSQEAILIGSFGQSSLYEAGVRDAAISLRKDTQEIAEVALENVPKFVYTRGTTASLQTAAPILQAPSRRLAGNFDAMVKQSNDLASGAKAIVTAIDKALF